MKSSANESGVPGVHQITPEMTARANELLADAERDSLASEKTLRHVEELTYFAEEAKQSACRKRSEAAKLLMGPRVCRVYFD